jgi:HSP20 family molecular chaperone IbpA
VRLLPLAYFDKEKYMTKKTKVNTKELFYRERKRSPQESFAISQFGSTPDDGWHRQNTIYKTTNDFYNGFFTEKKDIGFPIGSLRSEGKIIIEIALAGFCKEAIKLTKFQNILILDVEQGHTKFLTTYSGESSLKTAGFVTSWRLPPNVQEIASCFEDGLLRISIEFPEHYEVDPPEEIPVL